MNESHQIPRYWSGGLMEAIRSEDHTVELTAAENGTGAQVEIDGVPMFDGNGYPSEQFNIASGQEYVQYLTDDAIEKLEEVHADDE